MSAPRLNPEDLVVDSIVIGGPDDGSAAASILWNTVGEPMTDTCTEGTECYV